jgi:hypothetical protein
LLEQDKLTATPIGHTLVGPKSNIFPRVPASSLTERLRSAVLAKLKTGKGARADDAGFIP